MARPIQTVFLWRTANPVADHDPVRDAIDLILLSALAFLVYVIVRLY
jgi:hypothetical protein